MVYRKIISIEVKKMDKNTQGATFKTVFKRSTICPDCDERIGNYTRKNKWFEEK